MFLGPFRDSFEAIAYRFESAQAVEGSPFMRAIAPLIIFVRYVLSSPILGYGMGIGTNGGALLATGKAQQYVLAEDEWSRIIQELGPFFGSTYILFRVLVTFYISRMGVKSVKRNGNMLPIILIGFIGFYIFIGQITLQGTLNGYTWIFVGLIMASCKNEDGAESVQLKNSGSYLLPSVIGRQRSKQ
ncbi:hypothetical protein MKFW12EY_01830 [Methylomonas koyamae]|nr:hypothetical protein MKFW12EY_01830 [Methylomonas koyamae]